RSLIAVGNAIAIFGVLVVLAVGASLVERGAYAEPYPDPAGPTGSGFWVDGREVRNVFPYDSQGQPLSGVQLYDEDGQPIAVGDVGPTGPVEYTTDARGREIGEQKA